MKKNILPFSLFMIGLVILLFPHLAQKINKNIHAQQVEAIQREIKAMPREEKEDIVKAVKSCNEFIRNMKEGLNDPFTERDKPKQNEACGKVVTEKEYPLALEIPTLDLKIPIFLGASQENLAKGIGQLEGSSLPYGGRGTHTVLSGHRGMGTKAMFRHLDDLEIGDVFYIHTLEETLAYTVYDIKVILPHETESLTAQEGRDLASLFSCHPYPYNSHRLVVYGERE